MAIRSTMSGEASNNDLIVGARIFSRILPRLVSNEIKASCEKVGSLHEQIENLASGLIFKRNDSGRIEYTLPEVVPVSEEENSFSLDRAILNRIRGKAGNFSFRCREGFPFSQVDHLSEAETALEKSLVESNTILYHYMMLLSTSTHTANEFDETFKWILEKYSFKQIVQLFEDLSFNRSGYPHAHYYLALLIKQISGSTYEITDKEHFKSESIKGLLSHIFAQSDHTEHSVMMLKICLEILYDKWIESELSMPFFVFSCEVLSQVSFDVCKNKSEILISLLTRSSSAGKRSLVQVLCESADVRTAQIGRELLAALDSSTYTMAVPHFYKLQELLPEMDMGRFERIFRCSFPPLFDELSSEYNTAFMTYVNLDAIFQKGDLLIGVYEPSDWNSPPLLLAYKENKLIWGLPLFAPLIGKNNLIKELEKISDFEKSRAFSSLGSDLINPPYQLFYSNERIGVRFFKETKVTLINPENGEIISVIETPQIYQSMYDRLHVTSQGHIYQKGERDDHVLIGGSTQEGHWQKTFETKMPKGRFKALSTHCGSQGKNQLALFGPYGDQIVIENAIDSIAEGDKLYTIEKDADCVGQYQIVIRTLKDGPELVSEKEMSLTFCADKPSFKAILPHNQLLILSPRLTLIIDLNNNSIHECDIKPSSIYNIVASPKAAEFWTEISSKIWKINAEETTLLGKAILDVKLLAVDENDHLLVKYKRY